MTIISEYWSQKLGIPVTPKPDSPKPQTPSTNHLVSQYLRDKGD